MSDKPVSLAEQLSAYTGNQALLRPAPAGRPADHEHGILYQAPWEVYADGFCEHARRSARALANTGMPVHLRSTATQFRDPTPEDAVLQQRLGDMLRASIATYVSQVHQVVPKPGRLPSLVTHRYHGPEALQYINSRRVIYTVWERQVGVDEADVAALNLCGQAWVPCASNADLLTSAGVAPEKIRIIPCPYFDDDPHLKLAGRKRRPGPVRFYHIGKWEPRKAQDRIVEAFLRAFRPGEAMLLIKTSQFAPTCAGYPAGPSEALAAALELPEVKAQGWNAAQAERYVFFMQKILDDQQMLKLHEMCQVYLSLSRGEAMDMPAMDAKLSGNLLVYTPSGGPQDFSSPEDIRVPQTGTVPVHPFYLDIGWTPGSTYIDYSMDAAVAALKQAREAVIAGYPVRPESIAYCHADAVGRAMKENLEAIQEAK